MDLGSSTGTDDSAPLPDIQDEVVKTPAPGHLDKLDHFPGKNRNPLFMKENTIKYALYTEQKQGNNRVQRWKEYIAKTGESFH